MSAEVIELYPDLKRFPPDPDSLRERARERLWDAIRDAVDRSPIVIARRRTIDRQQQAAFMLGRECGPR